MSNTRSVVGFGGIEFLERSWAPEGPARGRILLVHGLGEHSGRYELVGTRLAAAGFEVIAPDLRGFGATGGRRAYVERFTDFLDDLAPCADRAGDATGPFIMYGHSMGGLIALAYALSDHPGPDLLILSAPALGAAIPGWKRALARVLGRIAPGAVVPNDITGDQLSRDPAVGEAYFADPLVSTRTTARLGSEMLAAMQSTGERLDRLVVPTLVFHGSEDSLVPAAVSEPLESRACVERVVLEGLRHECHNEDGGSEALALILRWLDRQLAGS